MTKRFSVADLHRLAPELGVTMNGPCPVEKPLKKRDNEEWRIQSNFFRWWHASCRGLGIAECLYYHVPNGSFLGNVPQDRVIRAKMLKLAGMTSGVVDCFLSVPVWERRTAGLYVEFKKPSMRTAKNGGLSDAQVEFIGFAMARGYICHVCYAWEEGRDVTLKYLKQ